MNRVPIVIEPEAKSDIRAARDYYSAKGDQGTDTGRAMHQGVFTGGTMKQALQQ